MEALPSESQVDPCEKCQAPVYGYVEQHCCDGRECGCMGLPLTPCWCDKCWAAWQADADSRAAQFTPETIQALEDLEHEEQP